MLVLPGRNQTLQIIKKHKLYNYLEKRSAFWLGSGIVTIIGSGSESRHNIGDKVIDSAQLAKSNYAKLDPITIGTVYGPVP
jgi:hypothetical protein